MLPSFTAKKKVEAPLFARLYLFSRLRHMFHTPDTRQAPVPVCDIAKPGAFRFGSNVVPTRFQCVSNGTRPVRSPAAAPPPIGRAGVRPEPNISDPSVFHDDLYAYSYFYDRTQVPPPPVPSRRA